VTIGKLRKGKGEIKKRRVILLWCKVNYRRIQPALASWDLLFVEGKKCCLLSVTVSPVWKLTDSWQAMQYVVYGVFTGSSKLPANVQLHCNIWQQTSSNSRVFWIHLLEVCWTFAGSCKQHPIILYRESVEARSRAKYDDRQWHSRGRCPTRLQQTCSAS